MTPWPFSWLPGWMNFLAIWTGYSVLLFVVYATLMATLRWWVGYHYQDEIEEWARMQDEARRVREKINGPS